MSDDEKPVTIDADSSVLMAVEKGLFVKKNRDGTMELSGAMMMSYFDEILPPQRRVRLTIQVDADDWAKARFEICNAANDFIDDFTHEPEKGCEQLRVFGGPDAGGRVFCEINREMTNERYHKELKQYLLDKAAMRALKDERDTYDAIEMDKTP